MNKYFPRKYNVSSQNFASKGQSVKSPASNCEFLCQHVTCLLSYVFEQVREALHLSRDVM